MKIKPPTSRFATHLILGCAMILSAAFVQAQSLLVSSFAGNPGNSGYADGAGTAARFINPIGLSLDTSQNLYVVDPNSSVLRVVTPSGVVSTLAGLAGTPGATDGTGGAATFNGPRGVAVDPSGNVYVADTGNNTIRKVTTSGVVTTFAGVAGKAGSIDGSGSSARFSQPTGLAVDSKGNLYVADSGNCTIRKLTPAGAVTTLAGVPGTSGAVDGSSSTALFYYPQAIAVDPTGNLYVADNYAIRKVSATGTVTTVVGALGVNGLVDGIGNSARFGFIAAIAIDNAGNLYVADQWNCTVRLITPSLSVYTLAGSAGHPGLADGTGSAARFNAPQGIAVSPSGDVYIADSANNAVRRGVASGAPFIGTPPLSQAAGVGNTVTFSVAASSASQLSYQWSFNGKAIPGATSGTYTTPPIHLADQGIYAVAVTNSVGTTVGSASLTPTFSHGPTYTFNSWSTSFPLPTATSYVAIAFDGSHLLTVGLDGTAYSSSDGTTWSASASNGPPGQSWGQLNSVISVPAQGTFVAVGNGGAVVSYSSKTFYGSLQASGTSNILTGIAAGGGSLVAVGYGGTCVTSDLTAASWKPSVTGTNQNINAIAFGNGVFVAVGLAGTVITSADGIKWTAQQLGSSDDLYGIAYGSRGFVAVGSNGGVFTSPDGSQWAQRAAPTQTVLVHVGYGDGTFVAIGFLGTVLTSGDEGFTWASQNSGTLARLDGVALDKDSFVLVGTGGVVTRSAPADPSRLVNLSARSTVGTGGNILIAGFVMNGTGAKNILLRGVGPTLGQFGVSQALPQAQLSLLNANAVSLYTNGAWGGGSSLSQTFAQVGAFALPAASSDSAFLETLAAGAYTAQLSGQAGATGVGLAEIYDADTSSPTARLINISARASIGTGSNILIAGFVIEGNTPETVLIRAVGPTLSKFGVTGPLSTPQLVLYDSANNTLAANAGWGGDPSLAQAFTQVGAFALAATSSDAAMLVTLPPGAYTAEVSGLNGATGVGLAEIYEVK